MTFPEGTDDTFGDGYGYQFWVDEDDFFALGSGGHIVGVFPKLDLVVVTKAVDEDFGELRVLTDEIVSSVRN